MSVSKFTPAELAELRRADAEIDAEDTPFEDELDAKLDIAASAQASATASPSVLDSVCPDTAKSSSIAIWCLLSFFRLVAVT